MLSVGDDVCLMRGVEPAILCDNNAGSKESRKVRMVTQVVSKSRSNPEYFHLSIDAVYGELKTCSDGLSTQEAQERIKQYGKNAIREVKGKPLIVKFLANFTHLMALLLWIGGIVAIIAKMPQLAIAVWMVNIINGAFSFWQEFRAEKATEALKRLLPSLACPQGWIRTKDCLRGTCSGGYYSIRGRR